MGPEPKSDFALIEELLEEELGSLEGKELPLGRGQGFIHGPGWKWAGNGEWTEWTVFAIIPNY